MNDSVEFEYTIKLANDIVAQRTEKSIREEDEAILKDGLDHVRRMRLSNMCSVSFCEEPDLLSQWRGYSDEGTGYAIGFSSVALSSIGEGDPTNCIYERADQVKIINELINDVIAHEQLDDRNNALSGAFMIALTQFATFFKDASFKEENE
jgi:hypothetical protein